MLFTHFITPWEDSVRKRVTLTAMAALTGSALAMTLPAAAVPTIRAADAPWVVSVGDSYISGEAGRWAGNTAKKAVVDLDKVDALGKTAYDDNPDGTGELIEGCHRSKSAEIHFGRDTLRRTVNSMNLACSGATTSSAFSSLLSGRLFKPGLDFYQDSRGNKGQAQLLKEFAAGHKVTMVVVSIGGNDFGFSDVITSCFLVYLVPGVPHCHAKTSVKAKLDADAVDKVTKAIVTAYRNVRDAMRQAGYAPGSYTIMVQNYPQALPPDAAANYRYKEDYSRLNSGGCGLYNDDSDWATSDFLSVVRGAVARAVVLSKVPGIRTLDLTHAFADRRLCEKTVKLFEDTKLPKGSADKGADQLEWIYAIHARGDHQQESLHPNYWGQLALRNCLRQAYGEGKPRSGTCTRMTAGGLNAVKEPNMTFTPTSPPMYATTLFAATQDSFGGNLGGAERDGIRSQLESGVRQLELDVVADNGTLKVGNGKPGSGVDTSGRNPKVFDLASWLGVVASWMADPANAYAAPITLVLDLRTTFSPADLFRLNSALHTAFGDRMLTGDLGGIPVSDLYGRVIPILAGDANARLAYTHDLATDPTVGINKSGLVITVEEGPQDTLWYWTGRVDESAGSVTWLSHGKYDTGQSPAVVLTDDNTVLEVHQSENHNTLWYRLGKIDDHGRVAWRTGQKKPFDDGIHPTLKLLDSSTVAEVHRRDSAKPEYELQFGSIGPTSVTWHDEADTDIGYFDNHIASSATWHISVTAGWLDNGSSRKGLAYRLQRVGSGAGPVQRVTYPQVAGVECDRSDSRADWTELLPYCFSFGTRAGTDDSVRTWVKNMRASGKPVRVWGFAAADAKLPMPTFAATDHPYADWYRRYLAEHYYST